MFRDFTADELEGSLITISGSVPFSSANIMLVDSGVSVANCIAFDLHCDLRQDATRPVYARLVLRQPNDEYASAEVGVQSIETGAYILNLAKGAWQEQVEAQHQEAYEQGKLKLIKGTKQANSN